MFPRGTSNTGFLQNVIPLENFATEILLGREEPLVAVGLVSCLWF